MTLSVNNEYENIHFDLCQIESRLRIVRFPLDHSAGAALWLFGYFVEILAGDSHVHSVNQPRRSLKIAEAIGCHHYTLLPYFTQSFTDDSQSLVRLSFQAWFQSCTEIPRPLQSTSFAQVFLQWALEDFSSISYVKGRREDAVDIMTLFYTIWILHIKRNATFLLCTMDITGCWMKTYDRKRLASSGCSLYFTGSISMK